MRDFDEQVWKVVAELGVNERHFNQLQHQYRILASTWLLAMFAGVGFALSKENLPFPPELLIGVVGLAGAVGVTLAWNLDLRVYHQLLDSYFVEGLRLEREHRWLPQIRSGMLSTQTEPDTRNAAGISPTSRSPRPGGVLARVVWFYLVGNTIALVVAFAGVIAFAAQPKHSMSGLVIGGLVATAVIVMAAWGRAIYQRTRTPLLEAIEGVALPERKRGAAD